MKIKRNLINKWKTTFAYLWNMIIIEIRGQIMQQNCRIKHFITTKNIKKNFKNVLWKSMFIFVLHLRRGETLCDYNVTIVICIVLFRAKRFWDLIVILLSSFIICQKLMCSQNVTRIAIPKGNNSFIIHNKIYHYELYIL